MSTRSKVKAKASKTKAKLETVKETKPKTKENMLKEQHIITWFDYLANRGTPRETAQSALLMWLNEFNVDTINLYFPKLQVSEYSTLREIVSYLDMQFQHYKSNTPFKDFPDSSVIAKMLEPAKTTETKITEKKDDETGS